MTRVESASKIGKLSWICLILALTILTSACSTFWGLEEAALEEIVQVQASEGWQNTNITLRPGDRLDITYLSDEWSPWPGGSYDAHGSGGDPGCRCNVMMAVSHAALIGRIGDHPPFLVGKRYQRVVGEAGELYLGINDVDLHDNSGSLRVLVVIEHSLD
jgi:hypothetical protein